MGARAAFELPPLLPGELPEGARGRGMPAPCDVFVCAASSLAFGSGGGVDFDEGVARLEPPLDEGGAGGSERIRRLLSHTGVKNPES